MINLKPILVAALEANETLAALLGMDRFNAKPIYQSVAKDAEKFPRITFFEMDNFDTDYADDEAYGSEVQFQIDIWSKGSTSAIAGEVDKIMKSLSFKRDSSADLYEDDTLIYHKGMRYSTIKEIEEV